VNQAEQAERQMMQKDNYLAESVEHVSNTTVPLAKVAFAASLLVENVQDNLDEQTKDIVKQLKE